MQKLIPIPIYNCKVKFIISNDARKTINKLHKHHNIEQKYEYLLEGMMFTVGMDLYNIVIDTNFLTYNTILHETFHSVMSITSDRGVFEEEQRAYLMGYLGQEIFNFLKLKNIEVK